MPHRSRFALGVLTAAEIALPPESDCAGPGFLVVPVAARAGADAHQSGDGARRPGELHCRVVVAPVGADARPSGDDAHCRGELHCQVFVYHLDVLHHLDSGGQWKAVQAERLGPHQDAPAEHSEFRDDH